jgi:hypothetical protein
MREVENVSGFQLVNCEVKELLVPLPAADMDGVANTWFERVPQRRYLPPALRGLPADEHDRREMPRRSTRAPVLPDSPDGSGRLVPSRSDPDVPAIQTSAEPKLYSARRAQRASERFRRRCAAPDEGEGETHKNAGHPTLHVAPRYGVLVRLGSWLGRPRSRWRSPAPTGLRTTRCCDTPRWRDQAPHPRTAAERCEPDHPVECAVGA